MAMLAGAACRRRALQSGLAPTPLVPLHALLHTSLGGPAMGLFRSAAGCPSSLRPFSSDSAAKESQQGAAAAAQEPIASPALPTTSPSAPSRISIYRSERPMLVLWIARLFNVQALTSGGFAGYAAWREFTKFASLQELQDVLMGVAGDAAPALDLRLSLGFTAFAGLSALISRVILGRTVTALEIERRPPAADSGILPDSPRYTEGDVVHIERPLLWSSKGRKWVTVPRKRITCAPATTTMTSFRLETETGRPMQNYLFPVPGWKSEDLPYLRTLIYGEYFRPEEDKREQERKEEQQHMEIEGFGPYRPAQFADPASPLFITPGQAAEEAAQRLATVPSPFTVRDGTVWADFVLPAKPTVPQLRAREKRAAEQKAAQALGRSLGQAVSTAILAGSTAQQPALGAGGAGGADAGALSAGKAVSVLVEEEKPRLPAPVSVDLLGRPWQEGQKEEGKGEGKGKQAGIEKQA